MSKLHIPKNSRAAARFGDWTLYELPLTDRQSFLWLRFKLMRPETARAQWGRDRAFWLSWGPLALRLARCAAVLRLQAQQPDLRAQVELFLELTYDRRWLIDVGGATDAEIDAEVGRLAARRALWQATQAAAKRNGEAR